MKVGNKLDKFNEKQLIKIVQSSKSEIARNWALEQLINKFNNLIKSIAYRYVCDKFDMDSLILAGKEGLYTAIMKYDPKKANCLSTSATLWIKQSIQRTLEKNRSDVQVPALMVKLHMQIEKYIQEFKSANGFKPSLNEIAKHFKISKKKAQIALKCSNIALSLDKANSNDGNKELTLGSCIPDDKLTPYELVLKNEQTQCLKQFLANVLNEKEIFVINHTYGLNNLDKLKIAKIAQILGLSQPRIKQIKIEAINKLKLNKQMLFN